MAYVKIGTHSGKRKGVKTYIGASGDTKPSSGLSVGSKCYEYDTKNWYITHNDGTTWTALVDLTGMVSDIDELTLEAEHLSCIFPDYASDIDLTCTLTSGAIDTFGFWAEIVDSDGTKLSACWDYSDNNLHRWNYTDYNEYFGFKRLGWTRSYVAGV